MSTRTVLLVDDHPPLRAGVAAMLGRNGGYDVVGEAGTVEDALLQARELRPEIVIADVTLPDGNGIDLARRIKTDGLAEYVLLLTMHARRGFADNALKAGGKTFLGPGLESFGRSDGTPIVPDSEERAARFESLSEREYEVFRLLAAGQNSKQVGVLLGISSKTVDNHRSSIMTKLQLGSIADIVRLAIRVGIVEP